MEQHCSEEILSAYLDGDLESEEAGRAAEHIAECLVCRCSLAQVRTIRDATSEMEQIVPPDRTWRAIQERIHRSGVRNRRLGRLLWVGIPALATALLVVALAGRSGKSARDTIRNAGHFGHVPAPELTKEMAADDAAREYQEYVRGIDRAIDECRTAMGENPGNVRVRQAYLGARSNRQEAVDRLVSGGE